MWVHVHKCSRNSHYVMLPENNTEYSGDYFVYRLHNATSSIHITINLFFSEWQ